MKVLAIYDKSGPKYHRVLMPVHLMGCDVKVVYIPTEDDLAWADIVLFNRLPPVDGAHSADIAAAALLAAKERYGFMLVNDLDDHWRLGPEHLLYHSYQHYGLSEAIEKFIMISDLVTVTHERLLEEVRPLNPNVHILPNCIPPIDQFAIEKYPDEKIRLFWAGGITHRKDLELLRRPARRINQLGGIKWILGGYKKASNEEGEEWAAMASAFTGGGQFPHAIIEATGVHEYYKVYALCDISMIPLQDNHFNSFKSNLKILEAANMAAPVIVSKVHPYLDFPDHLVNYVERQSDWYRHAADLVRNPSKGVEQGLQLQEYCNQHYNAKRITEYRRQLFESLISRPQLKAV